MRKIGHSFSDPPFPATASKCAVLSVRTIESEVDKVDGSPFTSIFRSKGERVSPFVAKVANS